MVKFECEKCGYSQGVSEKYAGKTVKCPKCQSLVKIGNEPVKPWLEEGLIKFYCSACGKKLAAKAEYCGRKLQCIKCKKEQIIPALPDQSVSIPKNEPVPSLKESESRSMADLLSMEATAEAIEIPKTHPINTNEAASEKTNNSSHIKSDKENLLKKPAIIIGGLICVLIMFLIFHTISKALKGDLTTKPKKNAPVHELVEYGIGNGDAIDFISYIRKRESYKLHDSLSTTLKLISNTEFLELSRYPVDVNDIVLDTEHSYIIKLNENDKAYYLQYNFGPMKKDNIIVYVIARKGFKSQIHGFRYNFQGYKPMSYATDEGEVLYDRVMVENFTGPFIWVLKYKYLIIATLALASIFYSICMVSVFMKAGEPGMAAIAPIYNLYVLAQIGDKPGWMGLVAFFSGFIPVVGPIVAMVFMFIISMGVAKAFEKGIVFGFGLFLMPLIFYPILAFSGAPGY